MTVLLRVAAFLIFLAKKTIFTFYLNLIIRKLNFNNYKKSKKKSLHGSTQILFIFFIVYLFIICESPLRTFSPLIVRLFFLILKEREEVNKFSR